MTRRAWTPAHALAIESPVPLSPAQFERYRRQLILPEVGSPGQEKLLASKVLVVGLGGLGSPAALYLAAAGVGVIGVADADRVELSNLNRQLLHTSRDLGRAKVASAADRLGALNPDVTLVEHAVRVAVDNVLELVSAYDFVIDGSDNFATKFLLNDACHFAGRPWSHAGVRGFFGQVMTIIPGQTACYRCLFEAPPPPGNADSCVLAGIVGAVSGIVGCLQAIEALKYLLGRSELLTNRLLTCDCLTLRFREVPVGRNQECVLCGAHPRIDCIEDSPDSGRGAQLNAV